MCFVECFDRAESGLLASSNDDDKLDEMQHSVFESFTSTHTPFVVEGKQSLSTQPSIVPFLVVDGNEETTNQSKVVCPLCFDNFNPDEIAQHADKCADQFDPVGTVSDSDDNDKENNELDDVLEISNSLGKLENENADPAIEEIKEAIVSKLCPNIDKGSTSRISVRRRYAFQDYVDACKKLRRQLKQNATLRVTFIGEPAVDDGGPRHEFFAGTVQYALGTYSKRMFSL